MVIVKDRINSCNDKEKKSNNNSNDNSNDESNNGSNNKITWNNYKLDERANNYIEILLNYNQFDQEELYEKKELEYKKYFNNQVIFSLENLLKKKLDALYKLKVTAVYKFSENFQKHQKIKFLLNDENIQVQVVSYLKQNKFEFYVADYRLHATAQKWFKKMRFEFKKFTKDITKFNKDNFEIQLNPELLNNQKLHILITHDKTTFHFNDRILFGWTPKGENPL
ncbi:hypothetical protein Glove_543g59 [Diversispora epigaea]|uniref:Uncharacterized protein n=1 Tax=Diversispora epigaea TaxID=1348612 RepID=A0A397GCF4_9GLOM|nr:hypothetical protein Glove_543g59 [Diversispora epigaea]